MKIYMKKNIVNLLTRNAMIAKIERCNKIWLITLKLIEIIWYICDMGLCSSIVRVGVELQK